MRRRGISSLCSPSRSGFHILFCPPTSPLLQSWCARTSRTVLALPLLRALERRLDAGAAQLSGAGRTVRCEHPSGDRVGRSVTPGGVCFARSSRSGDAAQQTRTPFTHRARGCHVIPIGGTQTLWVALAACGSALLLAVTNHISQNIASVPFLWVIPLSFYLLSFILVLRFDGWYRRDFFLRLLGSGAGRDGLRVSIPPSQSCR